ncbi:uncharacterized protein CTHT_0039840 [Thermochaetoides thermophila DSM 1495]|uniref:Bola-like protein n=1 Tax=Chaetomium thermophilum (strain DSM 1495 / CBS 144.50 / IMI 039719) TaxID=759272 RepID=G0S8P2_CHATD|nr:hypothetical protein CTHT_0039840 [Thermochaetoides thermophila DSM 1495]EGS20245.1 hypothetical protein CTHT_0039840 [Thermochaetoides thermophila DSM 1495]
MFCRACLRANAVFIDAVPSSRLLLWTSQRRSVAALVSSSRTSSILRQTQTSTKLPNQRMFSTSRILSSSPAPAEGASSAATSTIPEKPTYLTEGESQVWDRLVAEFAPTELIVRDISGGCGSMYGIDITSEKFKGLTILKQQRLVNAALKDLMKDWHGVQLKTKAP